MPTFCKTREEAIEAIENQDEFPCLLVVWNAEEVRELFVSDQREPLLTTEQAAEVLASMGRNFDGEYGITTNRIWNACEHHFPTCGTCVCGKGVDARVAHICQKAVEAVAANATAIAVARSNPEDKFVVWAARIAMDAVANSVDVFNSEEAAWLDKTYEKSKDRDGDVRHEKNPVIQEVCRKAYRRLAAQDSA